MSSDLLIPVLAVAVIAVIVSKGIGKTLLLIARIAVAAAIVMYLGTQSGWTVEGLIAYVEHVGRILVDVVMPWFESALKALSSRFGGS